MGRITKPSPWSVQSPAFFKILLGNFTEKMRIPPAFIKNFHGNFIHELTLKCQNGRSWPVKVKKDVGNLFFQNGWQGFVKDNLLEVGDLLVFRYVGNSGFVVQIFGKSGCEKIGALPHKKEQQEEKAAVCQCKYIAKSFVSTKKNSGEIQSKKRYAAGVKAKMVFETVSCPLKLKHPHFTGRWRPSKPYTVLIPKVFVREQDLIENQSKFFRDPSGKLWPVSIVHSGNRSDFSAGWNDFRIGNNLGGGDKCVFEFSEGSVIRVHIIQAKE